MSQRSYTDEERHDLAKLELLLADELKRCTDAIIAYTRHVKSCRNGDHIADCMRRVCQLTVSLIDQSRYLGMIQAELARIRVFESPAESLADLVAQQEAQAKVVARGMGEAYEGPQDESAAMDGLATVKGPKTLQ